MTAKNELLKTCTWSGFEGGNGSRWHERGKEERKEMNVKEATKEEKGKERKRQEGKGEAGRDGET